MKIGAITFMEEGEVQGSDVPLLNVSGDNEHILKDSADDRERKREEARLVKLKRCETILRQCILERGASNRSELKACLIDSIAEGAVFSVRQMIAVLSSKQYRQLLVILLETNLDVFADFFKKESELIKNFFKESSKRIILFFDHFTLGSLESFRYGAKALGCYALRNREYSWKHLKWTGRHPQAPISVVAKPYYLCELDLVSSIRNLADRDPDFWHSKELCEALSDGFYITLSYQYFVDVLEDWSLGFKAHNGRRDEAINIIEKALRLCPSKILCNRLLPSLSDNEMMTFLKTLKLRKPYREMLRMHEDNHPLTVLAGLADVPWKTYDDYLLFNVLSRKPCTAYNFVEEDKQDLDEIKLLLRELCPASSNKSAIVRDLLVMRLRKQSICEGRAICILEYWVVSLFLHLHLSTPSDLNTLLLCNGVKHEYTGPTSLSQGSGSESEDKLRHAHKKRKRKHRRRKRREKHCAMSTVEYCKIGRDAIDEDEHDNHYHMNHSWKTELDGFSLGHTLQQMKAILSELYFKNLLSVLESI